MNDSDVTSGTKISIQVVVWSCYSLAGTSSMCAGGINKYSTHAEYKHSAPGPACENQAVGSPSSYCIQSIVNETPRSILIHPLLSLVNANERVQGNWWYETRCENPLILFA